MLITAQDKARLDKLHQMLRNVNRLISDANWEAYNMGDLIEVDPVATQLAHARAAILVALQKIS